MLCRKKWASSEVALFTFHCFPACMKDAVAFLETWARTAKSEGVDTSSW
jgi:hypothetical protein